MPGHISAAYRPGRTRTYRLVAVSYPGMITALRRCRNREKPVATTRRARYFVQRFTVLRYVGFAPIGSTLRKRKWTPRRQPDTGLAAATYWRKPQYCGARRRRFDRRPRHARLQLAVARTSMIERMQLTHVAEAYERGDARFRMDSVQGKDDPTIAVEMLSVTGAFRRKPDFFARRCRIASR
jgi:hypothetical protein